jgi:uncharacterized SAM-binding protein YcdF (DUF218 family)
MTMPGWPTMSRSDRRRDGDEDDGRRRSATFDRLVGSIVASGAGLAFLVLLAGLVGFVGEIMAARSAATARGDGVVVLTGGRDRIEVGLGVLEAGAARRLLISGVHPATTAEAIRRQTDASPDLFACCVDLGRRAETTTGNARETADWAVANGFSSLVVVTSAYHLPRALAEMRAEFRRRGLSIGLQAIAVRRETLGPTILAMEWETGRVLLTEYVKYILANARLFAEAAGVTWASAPTTPLRLAAGGAPSHPAVPR